MPRKKVAAPFSASLKNPVDFQLSFTGLCTFVPRYDIDKHVGANHATVLLVDAHNPHATAHHMAHEPVLTCPLGTVGSGGRSPDHTWSSPTGGMALFYLQDQHLTFQSEANGITFKSGLKGNADTCPSYSNFPDVLWIAPLDQINPSSGTIKPSCLGTGTDPSFGARVALSQGTLFCSKIAKHGNDFVVIWQFGISPNTPDVALEQALADAATLATQVDGQVRLDTTLIRPATNSTVARVFTGGVGSSLSIIIEQITPHAPIVATILNSPLPDIVGNPPPIPIPRDPDYHFGHYYQLSARGGLPLITPFPDPSALQSCPGAGVPSLNTIHCPPSMALPELPGQ